MILPSLGRARRQGVFNVLEWIPGKYLGDQPVAWRDMQTGREDLNRISLGDPSDKDSMEGGNDAATGSIVHASTPILHAHALAMPEKLATSKRQRAESRPSMNTSRRPAPRISRSDNGLPSASSSTSMCWPGTGFQSARPRSAIRTTSSMRHCSPGAAGDAEKTTRSRSDGISGSSAMMVSAAG